jgi:hypothetical protein
MTTDSAKMDACTGQMTTRFESVAKDIDDLRIANTWAKHATVSAAVFV